MKKITLLICIICCAALTNAQNFRGGALAGLSVSQIDGDGNGGYHQPGFIVGAMVDKPLSEKFSLAMELKFIQKGSRISDYSVRINYVQIPLLAQYRFWNNFWGEAGFGFAYSISANGKDDYGRDEALPFEKTELAGIIGIAYDIPKMPLRLGARVAYSLLPVRKIEGAQGINTGQYNNNLEFSLTYFFK